MLRSLWCYKDSSFWTDNRFLEAGSRRLKGAKNWEVWQTAAMLLALSKATLHLPTHILGFFPYLPTTSTTLHVTLSNVFTSRHCLMIEAALGKEASEDIRITHHTNLMYYRANQLWWMELQIINWLQRDKPKNQRGNSTRWKNSQIRSEINLN